MNISLEYIKVFYYVTKYGSITNAAEKMCISQPAVSQAIKQLESELGCILFKRTRKGVVLTSEGTEYAHYVNKGYETIMAGEEHLMKMLNIDVGEIKIGASDMTLKYFLLPFLEKFHETYPNIKVNVTNGPTPETIRYLTEGIIDFGVVTTPFDNRFNNRHDINVKPVKKIQDIFIAGRDFDYLDGRKMNYSELQNLPLICLEKNTSTRRFMDEFLGARGVIIEPEFELATSDMIVQFAARNLGIGCVVSEFAEEYLSSGRLFKLEFNENLSERQMCVIMNSHRPLSTAAGRLLDIM